MEETTIEVTVRKERSETVEYKASYSVATLKDTIRADFGLQLGRLQLGRLVVGNDDALQAGNLYTFEGGVPTGK